MTIWLNWVELLVANILTWTAHSYLSGGPMHIIYVPILFTTIIVLPRPQILPAVITTLSAYGLTSMPHWVISPLGSVLIAGGINSTLMLFALSCGTLIRNLEDEKARSHSLLRQFQESQSALERAHRQSRPLTWRRHAHR